MKRNDVVCVHEYSGGDQSFVGKIGIVTEIDKATSSIAVEFEDTEEIRHFDTHQLTVVDISHLMRMVARRIEQIKIF